MTTPTADDLSQVPLFAELSDEHRATLAPSFEVEDFSEGKNIVTQGRAGYAFYVLAEGEATVSQDGHDLRALGPGDYFGEIAIMGEGRRTATVTAVTPVRAWVMFGTAFRVLEQSRPDVAEALQKAMADRLAAG